MKNIKIIFLGSSEFAVPALTALVRAGYRLAAVITPPDKPAGRRQELAVPPVKQAAQRRNLPVWQPKKISDTEARLAALKPDILVVAAYGQIIPPRILTIPRRGCLNIHPSRLPRYRGASPIQAAILNGDKKTAVTLMLMDEQLDHGPIISQQTVDISPQDTGQSLTVKLARQAAHLLIETLPQYLDGKIKPVSQDDAQATHTKPLSRADGRINWRKSAEEIARQVRAFYPWPGTWTEIDGKRMKIIKAKAVSKAGETTLPTGKGFLRLDEVQPAGKRIMSGENFFRGRRK